MSTCRVHISADVIFEVLSLLNRSELDGLAFTSKYFYQFTTKHFPTYPFNWLDRLLIYERCDRQPNFHECSVNKVLRYSHCPLEQLQDYSKSGKWMAKFVHVYLYSRQDIDFALFKKTLESISSLWRASKWVIEPHITGQQSMAVLHEVISWSTMFSYSSSTLRLTGGFYGFVPFHFHLYPWLYNCALIKFFRFATSDINLVTFLENIPKERQLKMKVQLECLTAWDNITELVFKAKQSFAAAASPCSYHLQIFHKPTSKVDTNDFFKVTNEKTGETLQYYLKKSLVTELKRCSM
uniref:F-box domain-containing protein n=1 Tax=Ditylenchus dipsaci TaxID=166011 RepID=A0A915DZU7_9BILA